MKFWTRLRSFDVTLQIGILTENAFQNYKSEHIEKYLSYISKKGCYQNNEVDKATAFQTTRHSSDGNLLRQDEPPNRSIILSDIWLEARCLTITVREF